MARQIIPTLAIILFLSVSSAFARDSPATAYVEKVCEDATYESLCLKTLLPDADRINLHPKKSSNLAIRATISEVQTTSSKITQLSKNPKLWKREVDSLNECATSVADTVTKLLGAVEDMNHLGGGNKDAKQSKRKSMTDKVTTVKDTANSCVNNMTTVRAREALVKEVEDALETLDELATNVLDLINHMEF